MWRSTRDLQHDRAGLVVLPHQRKEQAMGAIELGAVELAVGEIDGLLDTSGAEVLPGDGGDGSG